MRLPSFNMNIAAYGGCPNGFLQHDESCYKFFHSTRATWAEAMVNIYCCQIHEMRKKNKSLFQHTSFNTMSLRF